MYLSMSFSSRIFPSEIQKHTSSTLQNGGKFQPDLFCYCWVVCFLFCCCCCCCWFVCFLGWGGGGGSQYLLDFFTPLYISVAMTVTFTTDMPRFLLDRTSMPHGLLCRVFGQNKYATRSFL